MTRTASIALSGLQAASRQMQVSAHNIANQGTDGFRRQRLQQTAAEGGGVTTSLARAEEPGDDLVTDLVGMLQAKNAWMANLKVFKAQDETTGSLLDTLA